MAARKEQRLIGRKAKYIGSECAKLDLVVITAAMIGDGSVDSDNNIYLNRDDEIALAGGVKPTDRVEVRPIHPDGRVSWITCDPLFSDLRLMN